MKISPTQIRWWFLLGHVIINVGDAECEDGCPACTDEDLSGNQEKHVSPVPWVFVYAVTAGKLFRAPSTDVLVSGVDGHAGLHCVLRCNYVRQSEEQGADAHDQHTHAYPLWYMTVAAQVADKNHGHQGAQLVRGGNHARHRAADLKTFLNGGDDAVEVARGHRRGDHHQQTHAENEDLDGEARA